MYVTNKSIKTSPIDQEDERIQANRLQSEDAIMKFALGEITSLNNVSSIDKTDNASKSKQSNYMVTFIVGALVLSLLVLVAIYVMKSRPKQVSLF